MEQYRAAVVGASGYAGIELVRYLLGHPGFELAAAVSDSFASRPLAEVYPALQGSTDLTFVKTDELTAIDGLQLVFLAVPHTAALALVPPLLMRGVNVVDLSADFRLRDPDTYSRWYQHPHTAADLLEKAIYGLPELCRAELHAGGQNWLAAGQPVLVASPGCYPTATALATAPVLAAGALNWEQPVIVNAISGASGMGRKATEGSVFVAVNEDIQAYGVAVHRHTPEIEQTLSKEAGRPVMVQFTPHLAPLSRGLLATATLFLLPGLGQETVDAVYQTAYADEPFVQLLPSGQMPHTNSVVGSNRAQVGVKVDVRSGLLVASCAIDNLGKGAASQALQSANIVFDFPEYLGLDAIPAVV
ncbi:MAG: N-acetyl-gamma-glutamyl-phosphate reductase [Actinomycetia bacterium]|nr:N-acetyl-gamma-glutamyl-phosphate reductase [Actinomycetes bacterium]